jgi:hypothetical protein
MIIVNRLWVNCISIQVLLMRYNHTPGQVFLGLYGQVNKRIWWMPWRQQAMKDVVICDKPRGADKQALIRGFPNGETHLFEVSHTE